MYYLLEHRGLRQPVVSTINETSMVRRLGERYGVTVHETPVGFKYVGPKMIETGAMMGGEESGGYGFGMHLPERDGIYADLLLLDLFIREREAGRWPVSAAVAAPARDRRAVVLPARRRPRRPRGLPGAQGAPPGRARASRRRRRWPASRSSGPIALATNDGFKFWVDDGSWLLVRFSGTEPLVRVYAEATTPELRDALLAEGGRFVTGRRERPRATAPAGILDDVAALRRLDRGGMLGAAAGFPAQVGTPGASPAR